MQCIVGGVICDPPVGAHLDLEVRIVSMHAEKIVDGGEKKDPEISDDLKNVKIGGLGIHIVRKLMDDLHYERKNGKNKLTLKKVV